MPQAITPNFSDTGRFIAIPGGLYYDRQTGWAYDQNGQPLSDAQEGAGSRRDPRLGGNVGQSVYNAYSGDPYFSSALPSDLSRWYDRTQVQGGNDSSESSGGLPMWQLNLNQNALDRLRGRVPIGQLGQGGYSELIDPSQVEWDDEFGLVTNPNNIGASDPGGGIINRLGPRGLALLALAAGGGYFAGSELGLFGAGAGEGAGAAATIPESLLQSLPYDLTNYTASSAALTGLPEVGSGLLSGAGGASEVAGGGMFGPGGGLAPEEGLGLSDLGGGMTVDSSAWNELMNNIFPEGIPEEGTFNATGWTPEGAPSSSVWSRIAAWAQQNPLQAARMGLSLGTLASGAAGGAQGGGSGGQAISPDSPLRNWTPGGSTGNVSGAFNPNAPIVTAAGSPNAPVNTAGTSTATTGGTTVVGASPSSNGGPKLAIDPTIQQMIDFSNERLNRYRDKYIPLENLLIDEASVAGGEAAQRRAAGLAADNVSNTFRQARGTRARNIQRGGGGFFSKRGQELMSDLDLGEAGAKDLAQNDAIRSEIDSGFGKRMAVAGMGDKAVSQGLSSLSGGVQALLDQDRTAASREASANSLSGILAGISSREREGAADRAARRYEYDTTFGEGQRRYNTDFTEGARRYDLGRGDRRYEYDNTLDFNRNRAISDDEYRRAGLNLTGQQVTDQRNSNRYGNAGRLLYGVGSFFDSPAGRSLWGAVSSGWKKGGRVCMAEGGPMDEEMMEPQDNTQEEGEEQDFSRLGGMVEGPGDETSDSIPAYLSNGEFVMPAEAVKIIDQLDPGLLDRIQKLGLQVRKMGDRMESGEPLDGEYTVMED